MIVLESMYWMDVVVCNIVVLDEVIEIFVLDVDGMFSVIWIWVGSDVEIMCVVFCSLLEECLCKFVFGGYECCYFGIDLVVVLVLEDDVVNNCVIVCVCFKLFKLVKVYLDGWVVKYGVSIM